MKVPISRITIYGNIKDRKNVLEYLQQSRVVDISETDVSEFENEFSNMDTGDEQSEYLHEKSKAEKALEILEKYSPEEKSLTDVLRGRKILSRKEYYEYVDNLSEMLRIAGSIIDFEDKIEERRTNILNCRATAEELAPWSRLDIPLDFEGTKHISAVFGAFEGQFAAEEIEELYNSAESPPIYVETFSSDLQRTYAFIVCIKGDKEICEEHLRSIGFSKIKSVHGGIPQEQIEEYNKKIKVFESEIFELEKEIKMYVSARNALKFLVDYYLMRIEKYKVFEKLRYSKHVFILSGYVAAIEADRLKSKLERDYGSTAEIETADAAAPIILKNSCIAEPVEGVVETFAMPSDDEIDPTPIMAIFHYIFFGLMLSDAAYGLIMFIGSSVALARFKEMENGMKRTLRMFMYCGISTMFWGVMFGSYFGDIIPVLSNTFFGKNVTISPLWFEPVKNPMRMLMISFLLGLIHLFTGLGIKVYQCLRQKDYRGVFTDGICWFLLVGGGVAYLFHVDLFLSMAGISAKLPKVWANVSAAAAVTGALGILLFSAKGGGIIKRLVKGTYALYGVTGWLSDILSYSRLLALGLATGVIATVFNKMGSMFGDGVVGAILFAVVFAVGHMLNIGVNLLGAYVHTNRLQFVEFFGKFYDGGGRRFKAFGEMTKYYKVRRNNDE